MIRLATSADTAALRAIYAQYIDTAVTFAYTLPGEDEYRAAIEETARMYPYLVDEEDGRPTGYAYAHKLREREAYQWDAELSIYLDCAAVSRGLGTRLYSALLELLALQGVRTVYGIVTAPNERSFALHERMGFTLAGTLRRTGYKAGEWRDVRWYEKQIAPYDAEPAPLVPFADLPREAVEAVLANDR